MGHRPGAASAPSEFPRGKGWKGQGSRLCSLLRFFFAFFFFFFKLRWAARVPGAQWGVDQSTLPELLTGLAGAGGSQQCDAALTDLEFHIPHAHGLRQQG